MTEVDLQQVLVTEPEQLTAAWASAALGAEVRAVEREPVGTGQIGTCYRVRLDAPGAGLPPSVLVKLPAADPAARELVAGTYRREVRFYAELAPTLAVRVPPCHLAVSNDSGSAFTLVMADLAPAVQGDQVAGCTGARVLDPVVNLAGLHGPRWCDETLVGVDGMALNGPDDAALMAEMLGPATDIFLAGMAPHLDDATVATLRDVVPVVGDWALGRAERFGPVHGDYRLDNLLFEPGGRSFAVDWQTLSLALPARDLAFLLGTGLEPRERRAHEERLVGAYHDALVGHGVVGYDRDLCWEDYRYAMVQGPLIAVFGCAYGTRTERGDLMFAAMVRRSCAAIRDLGTLDLL